MSTQTDSPPLAVIDYGAGNLRSVVRALTKVGANIQVTNDPSAQYFPWGDVDENGGLYVGYYTRQYGDCESTGCGDYRLSTSADNGVSWSQRRITTGSMPNLTDVTNPVQQGFIGDYTSIHVAGQSVYLTWADTRGLNGTVEEDVYFAKVPRLTKAID